MLYQFPDPVKLFFEDIPEALGVSVEFLKALGSILAIVFIAIGLLLAILSSKRIRFKGAASLIIFGILLGAIFSFDYGFIYFGIYW